MHHHIIVSNFKHFIESIQYFNILLDKKTVIPVLDCIAIDKDLHVDLTYKGYIIYLFPNGFDQVRILLELACYKILHRTLKTKLVNKTLF